MENKVILGDCLDNLKKLKDLSVDLVYLDPPFFSQRLHLQKDRSNSKEYSFSDKWLNVRDYINFLQTRLSECKRVLKNTGSIFLHCDSTASHYLRLLLDEIFMPQNFQSEIIWFYRRWSNAKKGLLNSHQTIYFYSKTADFKFNTIYCDYSPTTNVDQILHLRERDKNGKTKYKKDSEGNGVLSTKKQGVPLADVWEIPYLNPKAKERVGYPTQKPILLLERIITIATDENDIVLDPFCGSGSTLVASKILKRRFIGIDISKDAVELSQVRLQNPIKSESALLQKGKAAYENQNQKTAALLKLINAVPVQRNNGIDGFLKDHEFDKPVPVKVQDDRESLDDAAKKLINACKRNALTKKILIKTHESNQASFFSIDDPNLIIIDNLKLSSFELT